MLESFRNRQFQKNLRQAIQRSTRQRVIHTLKTARRIAVLVEGGAAIKSAELQQWLEQWQKQQKEVKVLTFLNEKRRGDTVTEGQYTLNDLTWFYKPKEKAEQVQRFLREKFDVLVCFNPNALPALDWVAAHHTAAGMKMGLATELPNDYDVQIELAKTPSFAQFIGQLTHYLDTFTTTYRKHAPLPTF